jgi:hypothetical protein
MTSGGPVANLLLAAWWIDLDGVIRSASSGSVVKDHARASGEDCYDTGNRARGLLQNRAGAGKKGSATGSGSGSGPLPPLKTCRFANEIGGAARI